MTKQLSQIERQGKSRSHESPFCGRAIAKAWDAVCWGVFQADKQGTVTGADDILWEDSPV